MSGEPLTPTLSQKERGKLPLPLGEGRGEGKTYPLPKSEDRDRYFDPVATTLLAALAFLGAYYGQPPLVGLAVTLLLTLRLTRFWSAHSLDALRYERHSSDDRAFPGDELLLSLRLANDKLLPLPWLEVDDRIPWQLAPVPVGQRSAVSSQPSGVVTHHSSLITHHSVPSTDAVASGENGKEGRLRLAGSVSWHERITWRYRLRCQLRGIYQLGPAMVTSGDPFGFFPRSVEAGTSGRLVVYPRLIPLETLGIPPSFPLGETKAERWIFEDASRTVGVRDYRREDPFKRIHWKATARRQELQVKLHEPTTTLETALFLAVDAFGGWGSDPNPQPLTPNPHSSLITHHSSPEFELAVSVVATLAHRLIEQRCPVGLYVNGGMQDSRDPLELPPGSSQEQLIRILELLAGVESLPCSSIEAMLADVAPRLPWGSSAIVVVGSLSEGLLAALQPLRRAGRNAAILVVGADPAPEAYDGIPIYRVTRDE